MILLGPRRLGYALLGLISISSAGPAEAQATSQSKEPTGFAVPGSADSASAGRKEVASTPKKAKTGPHVHRPNAPVATFPGFRILPDGKSRLYVELTKTVTVEQHPSGTTLTYALKGAEVLARNNKNALVTTHFAATPVDRARLVAVGNNVELVIDLRKAVSATHQVVAGENGTARLEIDFPAGDYPTDTARFTKLAPGRKKSATKAAPGDDTSDSGDEPPAKADEAPATDDAAK